MTCQQARELLKHGKLDKDDKDDEDIDDEEIKEEFKLFNKSFGDPVGMDDDDGADQSGNDQRRDEEYLY